MDERGVRTDPGSMRKSILLLAVLAAAVVLPAAALAHTTSLFHGADVASVKSYPNSPHSEITVYDRECDGNYVHARYRLSSGELRIVTDSSGCTGGLEFRFAPTGKQILRYQLCEDNEGCTAIKTT